MPLRRAGTVTNAGGWYDPGSAKHHAAKERRAASRPGNEPADSAHRLRNRALAAQRFSIIQVVSGARCGVQNRGQFMAGPIEEGLPYPLGAHWSGKGTNFALFSA